MLPNLSRSSKHKKQVICEVVFNRSEDVQSETNHFRKNLLIRALAKQIDRYVHNCQSNESNQFLKGISIVGLLD